MISFPCFLIVNHNCYKISISKYSSFTQKLYSHNYVVTENRLLLRVNVFKASCIVFNDSVKVEIKGATKL